MERTCAETDLTSSKDTVTDCFNFTYSVFMCVIENSVNTNISSLQKAQWFRTDI